LGCEPQHLREAIRRESIAFWKDESKVEREWRTRLRAARARVIKHALETEGLDPAFAWSIATAYSDEHQARLHPFNDAYQTLDAVRTAGYKLGLITNGPQSLQRDKIEKFELEDYFDVIVIEGEFGVGKPDRRVFEHALSSTNTAPGKAWHVGDNVYADIFGAQRVGIHAVWIHRDRLELGEEPIAVPDAIIANLTELSASLGIEGGRGGVSG
jgi:putative hydrolase of the HAD superfamily